jgi:hypothetical protein
MYGERRGNITPSCKDIVGDPPDEIGIILDILHLFLHGYLAMGDSCSTELTVSDNRSHEGREGWPSCPWHQIFAE